MLNTPAAPAAGEAKAQHAIVREEMIDRWFGGGDTSDPAVVLAEMDNIRQQLLAEEEERLRRQARQTECEASPSPSGLPPHAG